VKSWQKRMRAYYSVVELIIISIKWDIILFVFVGTFMTRLDRDEPSLTQNLGRRKSVVEKSK
jgi:hypothetical protein